MAEPRAGNDKERLYFIDGEIERGSARGWVGAPDGHVPLAEARQRAIDELTDAEATLAEKQARLEEATSTYKKAEHARDRAYNARQTARLAVKRKQERVAYVCSTDAPKEPLK